MDLIIINQKNIQEYSDILSIFFNCDLLTWPNYKIQHSKIEQIEDVILECQTVFHDNFKVEIQDIKTIIIPEELGGYLCDGLPIKAGTIFLEGVQHIIIAWMGEVEYLKRVFIHEYTHAVRMDFIKIKNHIEYLEYISESLNVVYEELVAISIEKHLCNLASWDEASNKQYNLQWEEWDKEDKIKEILWHDNTKAIKSLSEIYYLTYYICSRYINWDDMETNLFCTRSEISNKLKKYLNQLRRAIK